MRQSWTDERLDDLNAKVDRGFDRVETELRTQRLEHKAELTELRTGMNTRFEAVDTRFDALNARFDALNARFDALNRTLLGFAGTIIVAFIASRVVPL